MRADNSYIKRKRERQQSSFSISEKNARAAKMTMQPTSNQHNAFWVRTIQMYSDYLIRY